MFTLITKHQYISRAVLMVVLMFTLVAPLSAPIMVLAKSADPYTAPKLEFGCGVTNLGACIPQAAWGVMVAVGQVMTLASLALNYSVQELVVGMGSLIRSEQMQSVNVAWRTMRDLVNVFLVFLTIFIGIATIIGISGYGYKQLLWKVVLAALFVNFSITFTKFIIDISNIVTIATYGQLLQVNANQPSPGSLPADCTGATDGIAPPHCLNKGLAAVFLHQTKITTIYSSGTVSRGDDDLDVSGRLGVILWIAIFGSIFFLITAFIFGAAAFFITMRFAILLLLIMFSPIGLVAWITGVSGIGRQWWHALLNQSFFLPIMFLMWWASVQVMVGMNDALMRGNDLATAFGAPVDASIASNAAGFEGLAGVFLYFFIVSMLMIASLIISRNLGAYGANAAMKAGQSWSRSLGGTAFAYTAGAASGRAADLYRRKVASAHEQDEQGNYVSKNSPMSKFYRKIAGTKIDRAAQSTLGYMGQKGVLGTKSYGARTADDKKMYRSRRGEVQSEANRLATQRAVTTAGTSLPGPDIGAMRARVASLSSTDIERIRDENPAMLTSSAFAVGLSAKQLEKMEESGQFSQEELTQIKAHRASRVTDALTPSAVRPVASTREARSMIGGMTESEQKTLGADLSKEIVSTTKPLTPARADEIVQTLQGKMIANLKDDAIMNPMIRDRLTGAHLQALDRADRLADSDRKAIAGSIGLTSSATNFLGTEAGRMWG